ncbi:MAG: bifunctional phosphoribosylaminoimidazolecarboxamide formyltransferase/IMP cyclohydrolase [Bacteroidetes bacterium]|nr:bifunctional phosphoribosylaminoimidazolecarboxamide formyltransferase/IMP cyclohydrolase [Bacteroidota bacterium]
MELPRNNQPLKKIKSALISVFHKDGLESILDVLNKNNVVIYSTGGTYQFIEEKGYDVKAVEDLTTYPSILGGRVKTLHPKIFGGILSRRALDSDVAQLDEYDIPEIDLVIVDLYPFEETVKNTNDEAAIIEKIDIGGIALIRAAAKNYKDVAIVSHRGQYQYLVEILNEKEGCTSLSDRKQLAAAAFNTSSHYDTAIFNYFNQTEDINALKTSFQNGEVLRYGENPHQSAKYFGDLDAIFEKLNGKALSYNNLVDIDAAVHLIGEFTDTTFVVIKHTNSCGVASRPTVLEAWKAALAGDPVSAFGGILITNAKIDLATAQEINKIFYEVLIAPEFDGDALALLQSKKNTRILKQKSKEFPSKLFKTLLNGVIEQDADKQIESKKDWKKATEKAPSGQEENDLEFALKVCKHLKSNTIVLAKDNQLLGMGCGQTSRVDALRQAIEKAGNMGFDLKGAVMASDAFFPFPDCVDIAGDAGITAVVQPGGSIKDQDSIDCCNQKGMSMVLTGIRHFKH